MSILDCTKRRRSGFTAGEVLLTLLVVGVVISIFVGLNNFTGVKQEKTAARMASFERMIADIHVSLKENKEITPEQACDAEFLKNYYLNNLPDDAVEFPGYLINDKKVTAIKIPGYGVLAILPNSENDYCETHWEDEVLNVSNPPVAFIAIDEDIASSSYTMNEITVDNEGFAGITQTETAEALFTQNNAIAISSNKKAQQIMSNDVPNDIPVEGCNASEFIWAIKSVFYNKLEQNNYCKQESPFYKKLEADYCCPEYSRMVYMGHYSTITDGCIPSFCPGSGFVNKDELDKYNKCSAGDPEACSNVEIKDTGMVNFYCKNGTNKDYVRCGCPNDKNYWIPKRFFAQETLLSYDESPIDNGLCVPDCTKYRNEEGKLVRFIPVEDIEQPECRCPRNMVFNEYPVEGKETNTNTKYDIGVCICSDENLIYSEADKDCICPTEGTEEYDALIAKILDENKKYLRNRVYDSTAIKEEDENKCQRKCNKGEITTDGIHCIPKPPCEGFTVGDDCTCPAIEDISKNGNTWTNSNNKTITFEENEIYDINNPTGCKNVCQGYLKPNTDRDNCICDEAKVNANKKSYEYYNGQKDTNCIGTCDKEYKKPRKSGSNYTCECYDTPQKAIEAVKSDNSTLTVTALTSKLAEYHLDGFQETGTSIYKYNEERETIAKWNKEKASCMEACPDAAECAKRGQNDPDHIWLVDPLNCDCKVIDPDPDCETNPEICPDPDDCAEKCVTGEIAINDTQTLLAIGNHPQYPADGHYCMTQNIEIKINESTITDPILKDKIDTLLPLTPNGFEGTFKGQGYKITGLTLNIENVNLGLFSKINKVKENNNPECPTVHSVTNLIIDGTVDAGEDCTKNRYAGILTGQNAGDINETIVTGSVTGCSAGGIVGNNSGTIRNSSVSDTTSVNGTTCAGGFVSENSGTIAMSSVNGNSIDILSTNGNAGGFVCINNGKSTASKPTLGIDHSFVKAKSVLASNAGGFAYTNSGTLSSVYVEETPITGTSKAAGLININSTGSTINDAYVYGITLQANNISGFANTNSGIITNVYSILTNPANNTVFADGATTNNTVNSYFGYNSKNNITLLPCTAGEGCTIKAENIIREIGNFKATPGPDMYKNWSYTTWCFNCDNERALLQNMPTGATKGTSCKANAVDGEECPCPTKECTAPQVPKPGENECKCTCEGVTASDAWKELREEQKDWYVQTHAEDDNNKICLACGSYSENGKKLFDYEVIDGGENDGYCGCPSQANIETQLQAFGDTYKDYFKGTEYVQGGANKNINKKSCRENDPVQCLPKDKLTFETYEYYDTNNTENECKSNCTIDGVAINDEFIAECRYLTMDANNKDDHSCKCFDTANEAAAVDANNETLKSFEQLIISAEDSDTEKQKTLEVIYNEEGIPIQYWDSENPGGKCISDCPTAEDCAQQGKVVNIYKCQCETISDCPEPPCPDPEDCSEHCLPGEIVIDDTQSLVSIGKITAFPSNGHYCVKKDIEINLDTITNPILKQRNDLLPLTPDGFAGTLKGQGNTISKLTLNEENSKLGLFSKIIEIENPVTEECTYTNSVTNLKIEGTVNADITSCDEVNTDGETKPGANNTYAGILAGENSGVINKVNVTGNVTGCSAGGIVGNNSGTIRNSSATGTSPTTSEGTDTRISYTTNVTGITCAGGLVSENSGLITMSYVNGARTTSTYNAGGFVCINNGTSTGETTPGIDHSFVAAGDISALSSAGFASINRGTIQSSYVEGEDIIVDGTYAAGFVNENNHLINDLYVYNINLIGNKVAGFVNEINGNIQNVYAILKKYEQKEESGATTEDSVNIVFTPSATESDIINSYFGKFAEGSNIDSLSACSPDTSGCQVEDDIVVREEADFSSTPNTDIYHRWSADTWCFHCDGRALLKNMPEDASQYEENSCQASPNCSNCVEKLHEIECQGVQKAKATPKGDDYECQCSCEGVPVTVYDTELNENQQKWYKKEHDDNIKGYMCLKCGSYIPEGTTKALFDYVLITDTESENYGYCGCPSKDVIEAALPEGSDYFAGYDYKAAGAMVNADRFDCRMPKTCDPQEPDNFEKEMYQYYDANNPSNECKSNCTINESAINDTFLNTCKYLKTGEGNACECFDTANEALSTLTNASAKNQIQNLNLKTVTIPAKYSITGEDETREVLIGETEKLPVKYWDKSNPGGQCLTECPTIETCDGTLVPEWCYCIPKDGPVPEECANFDKAIMIKDTQALQSIGYLPSYPADQNYCIVEDITFTPSNVTNTVLKKNLVGENGTYDKFIPIPKFTGIIEGGNNIITELTINSTNPNVGMITEIGKSEQKTGEVRNLDITNATIIGKNSECTATTGFVGILAGSNSGLINNVRVNGAVTGCNAGGIAGNNSGTIQYSSVKENTTISGNTCAGGLVSENSGYITMSYVKGATTSATTQAGGFVCKNTGKATADNSELGINHSSVDGGSVASNISAGFAGNNSGSINSAYVETTTIKAKSETSLTGQKSAGFANTNTGTINNVYAYDVTIKGGSGHGFISDNQSNDLKNAYLVINGNSSATSLTGFTSTISGETYKPSNVYWVMGDTYTDTISACSTDTEQYCKNSINKRLLEDLKATPSEDMYNEWSYDTWCFSCDDRALLKGMPNKTLDVSSCIAETAPEEDKCPNGRCGNVMTPDGTELSVSLQLDSNGECVCPANCDEIDGLDNLDIQLKCDTAMRGIAQDLDNEKYCLMYKCAGQTVTSVEGHADPNIQKVYNEVLDELDGTNGDGCGCPEESVFADYLSLTANSDLEYDNEWMNITDFTQSNFSCLKPDCGDLVWIDGKCQCPEGTRTAYTLTVTQEDESTQNIQYTYINDGIYLYSKEFDITKNYNDAMNDCNSIGGTIPTIEQAKEIIKQIGETYYKAGATWSSSKWSDKYYYFCNEKGECIKSSDKKIDPTSNYLKYWCIIKEDKIKDLELDGCYCPLLKPDNFNFTGDTPDTNFYDSSIKYDASLDINQCQNQCPRINNDSLQLVRVRDTECGCPVGENAVYNIEGDELKYIYVAEDLYLYEQVFGEDTFENATANCARIGGAIPTQAQATVLKNILGSTYYGNKKTWFTVLNNKRFCSKDGIFESSNACTTGNDRCTAQYWCVATNDTIKNIKNNISDCKCAIKPQEGFEYSGKEYVYSPLSHDENCQSLCPLVDNIQTTRSAKNVTECTCPSGLVSIANNVSGIDGQYIRVTKNLYLYNQKFSSETNSNSGKTNGIKVEEMMQNNQCAEVGGRVPSIEELEIIADSSSVISVIGRSEFNQSVSSTKEGININRYYKQLKCEDKHCYSYVVGINTASSNYSYWCVATEETMKKLRTGINECQCYDPKIASSAFTFKNNNYYYKPDQKEEAPYCQQLCPKKENVQLVRDKFDIQKCNCPSDKTMIYKDNDNKKYIFIDDGIFMYNTKSGKLTKEQAQAYCAEVGSDIPNAEQLQKANRRLSNTIGASWISYISDSEQLLPTWCFANEDKIKELQEADKSSCANGCQIQCNEDELDTEKCTCNDGFECPNYDELYVIRYKEKNNKSTLYQQCMGLTVSGDGERDMSDHFKQIAEKLSQTDKNRKFNQFHAYIIGVTYDEENKVDTAKVVAAFSPRVWYYKFTAELAETVGIPLTNLIGTTKYEYVNPDVLNIECKYTNGNTSNNYDDCIANNGEITKATCKSETTVAPYILGYNYNNTMSNCRGAKNSSGTGDTEKGVGMTYISEYERSSDCVQLCEDDELATNEECLNSCLNVTMVENIFAGCGSSEFCKGGSIQLNPLCPPIGVAETFRRYSSPLILDLLGDGYKFTSVENGVRFDLDADGIIEQVAWTDFQKEFDDAFLWYDKNNDGKILNGKELFGDQNGAENGFYELAKYDKNKDNVINKDDTIYEKLQLWVDFNKNAHIDKGETKTLAEAGVIEIPLEFNIVRDKDGNIMTDEHGNITGFVGKFKQVIETIVNGIKTLIEKIGTMIDVFFASN